MKNADRDKNNLFTTLIKNEALKKKQLLVHHGEEKAAVFVLFMAVCHFISSLSYIGCRNTKCTLLLRRAPHASHFPGV